VDVPRNEAHRLRKLRINASDALPVVSAPYAVLKISANQDNQ
jgi:hypothetical protein